MQSGTNLFLVSVLIFTLPVLGGARLVQASVEGVPETAIDEDANEVSFPYIGEIAGAEVNIRSGPGMNYYRCGKLSEPNTVTVVRKKFGWSCIVPPPDSFSWISQQFVTLDVNNPEVGVISGDEVRIWAGSEYVQPMHSTSLQTKLDSGDTVTLLGEEKGDYYKIAPPAGAHLWVSTQYIKFLSPIEQVKLPKPVIRKKRKPAPVVKSAIEAQRLKEYYELTKQIEVELGKPMTEQNYADVKKALAGIADDSNSGKAAIYSKFQLEQIDRFELAIQAGKELELQDAELRKTREQIQKSSRTGKKPISILGEFAVIGTLHPSVIYAAKTGPKRYMVLDEVGKLICYAQPQGPALNLDLTKYKGKKVGLVGIREPDRQTSGTLVKFTEVVGIE